MTLRGDVKAALSHLRALRGEQVRQAVELDGLRAESAAHGELLRQILDELQTPEPAGSVTIDVGPVSDIPSDHIAALRRTLSQTPRAKGST